MKKTEKISVIENYLSANGVDIEKFYSFRIDNYDIVLQGNFADLSGLVCHLKTELKVNDMGHATGHINVSVENTEEIVSLKIVLT